VTASRVQNTSEALTAIARVVHRLQGIVDLAGPLDQIVQAFLGR
jgi:hypothetical protein